MRFEDAELTAIDSIRGDVPRERWIRRLCADAVVAAGSGLAPRPVEEREPREAPPSGVLVSPTATEDRPLTRMQLAERRREQLRIAQKGGPNRA